MANAIEDLEYDTDEMYAAGVEFLRSIAKVYGAERAHQVWEAMGPAIGDEVKFEVFTRMLTGTNSTRYVTVHGPIDFDYRLPTGTEKVKSIKAIRKISGLGLKEAKNFIEELSGPNAKLRSRLEVTPGNQYTNIIRAWKQEMRSNNIEVS